MKQSLSSKLASRKFLAFLATVAGLLAKSPDIRHDPETWRQIVELTVAYLFSESAVDFANAWGQGRPLNPPSLTVNTAAVAPAAPPAEGGES